jgi:predicted regulator of Ras-like GTPase activity (Roadblock/LC7/MglB family)
MTIALIAELSHFDFKLDIRAAMSPVILALGARKYHEFSPKPHGNFTCRGARLDRILLTDIAASAVRVVQNRKAAP